MKDIYVKFETPVINGESRDAGKATGGTASHVKWVEVSSWTHSMRQPKSATASTAGGHTAERVEHDEMVFTKDIDSVSPHLYLHCSSGTTFGKVTIEFMRAMGNAAGDRLCYLKIELLNVLIGTVTPSVAGEGLPTESFSLKYAAVKWTYTPMGIDGKAQPKVEAAWSLSKNTPSLAA